MTRSPRVISFSRLRRGSRALLIAGSLLLAACGGPEGTWVSPTGEGRFEFLKDGTVVVADYTPSGMMLMSATGQWREADKNRYIITIPMMGMQASATAVRKGKFLRVQMANEMFCLEKVASGETKPKPRPEGDAEESRCS